MTYTETIADTLKVTLQRARLVEGHLRLQYGTLDSVSRADIKREYTTGGIAETIDADIVASIKLADSFGIRAVKVEDVKRRAVRKNVREIMTLLSVDQATAEKVEDRMTVDFSECSHEEFRSDAVETFRAMSQGRRTSC